MYSNLLAKRIQSAFIHPFRFCYHSANVRIAFFVTTNAKGEFTFPKLLSVGDILIISYIGYDKIEVPIKASTTTLDIVLTEDLIEFVGAPSSEKPYKSKRNKRNKQKGK